MSCSGKEEKGQKKEYRKERGRERTDWAGGDGRKDRHRKNLKDWDMRGGG